MKILAIESSALACSVCLTEDDHLIAQSYENSGLTHSVTLLPMVEELMKRVGVPLEDVEVVAVAAGPGSFTGVRIGVSAAKGLAWALNKPCAGVSTLEAMAWNAVTVPGRICPVMDARRQQVYTALFSSDGERLTRLTTDRAIGLDELAGELAGAEEPPLLVGDGADLTCRELTLRGIPVRMCAPNLRFQAAWGVARAGLDKARAGELVPSAELVPQYLRLSQAERERLEKLNLEKV